MFHIVISAPAKEDIQEAYDWWGKKHSLQQAEAWYRAIHREISHLRHTALTCPLATEKVLRPEGIRQLLFGIGKRPTHRIVFSVDEQEVIVLRIRHVGRGRLRKKDLPI